MVIAHDFEYVRASSIAAAIDALSEPGAQVLAGGTDVVPWLRDGLIAPVRLVDIKAIPDLHSIAVAGDTVRLGALTTFTDLIDSEDVAALAPMLGEMAHHVASVGIRNRATIVGNLCSAVPSLDAGPALLVYDAVVEVASAAGGREVPLADWFMGPRQTRLLPGEIATGVRLRLPSEPHAAAFVKLSRYSGEDLAQANLAVLVTDAREYRVAFGAVAPVPFRAGAIEAELYGRSLDDGMRARARALVDEVISPITDVRASAEYRAHMCRVMLDRALRAAVDRLTGDGPPYPARLI